MPVIGELFTHSDIPGSWPPHYCRIGEHRPYYCGINPMNSLPNSVVDANSVNAFKARLDKFWLHQEIMFDFTADLSGTGNRSVLS